MHKLGQARLRRVFEVGDRVQVKDPKGRLHTITLVKNGLFQTNRGDLHHNDVLGCPDGQVITTPQGRQFQVLRPLLCDYVMSMPRGATIVYPKDAGTIIHQGDIFEGATVLEAGVGSGALSMSLLGAVGEHGHLISVERRAEFADIARANVDLWFGGRHPAWDLRVGELSEVAWKLEPGSVDRVVLDMLAPWENIDAIAHALIPGGVLMCYVATVTQLSRLVEDLRGSGRFTDALAFETLERQWHVQGLALRPEHRMVGHTGFLVRTRLLAEGSLPQRLVGRTPKDAEDDGGQWDQVEEWSEESVDIRTSSTKKVRRVRRDVVAKAQHWLAADGQEQSDDGMPE